MSRSFLLVQVIFVHAAIPIWPQQCLTMPQVNRAAEFLCQGHWDQTQISCQKRRINVGDGSQLRDKKTMLKHCTITGKPGGRRSASCIIVSSSTLLVFSSYLGVPTETLREHIPNNISKKYSMQLKMLSLYWRWAAHSRHVRAVLVGYSELRRGIEAEIHLIRQ